MNKLYLPCPITNPTRYVEVPSVEGIVKDVTSVKRDVRSWSSLLYYKYDSEIKLEDTAKTFVLEENFPGIIEVGSSLRIYSMDFGRVIHDYTRLRIAAIDPIPIDSVRGRIRVCGLELLDKGGNTKWKMREEEYVFSSEIEKGMKNAQELFKNPLGGCIEDIILIAFRDKKKT